MLCKKCNAVIEADSSFCSACGAKVEVDTPFNPSAAFKMAGDLSNDSVGTPRVHKEPDPVVVSVPDEDRKISEKLLNEDSTYTPIECNNKPNANINFISLALVVICAIVWFAAPFMAVNYYTFGDQPTALELLQDEVTYIGDLEESAAYKAAVISIIGLAICLVCVLCKSRVITRIAAAGTLIPLMKTIIDVMQWADDSEEFMDFFGAAYWCIVVGLVLVVFLGGRMRKSS